MKWKLKYVEGAICVWKMWVITKIYIGYTDIFRRIGVEFLVQNLKL
jgi:hypothetical protein